MNKKKLTLSLLCTNSSLKSNSLKEIAKGLSTKLGFKVWRTIKVSTKRKQFQYGQGIDKLTQYKWFEQNKIPSLLYTTVQSKAQEWVNGGSTVFGRKLLNARCGHGIVVYEDTPVDICPVYTLYKKKKREFRVHIFMDKIVVVVEKKRKKGFEGEQDTKIRNLANGYIFVQDVQNEPQGLRELALQAAKISPSHFRGVDIGYNEKANELFVIEVNSAPGIQGSNINKYVETILEHV